MRLVGLSWFSRYVQEAPKQVICRVILSCEKWNLPRFAKESNSIRQQFEVWDAAITLDDDPKA